MKTVNNVIPVRRNDLDWLRIYAVLLLVPFHSALIFVLNPESIMYVKDTTNSILLDRMAGWVHQFHMPLLFFISGASAWFALQKRSSLKFIGERFIRLLLPTVAGIIILIPPMTYLGLRHSGVQLDFTEHFINFWKINPADLAGIGGSFTPAHLWFLIFLFVFTTIALPLFQFLNSSTGQKVTKAIASMFTRQGMLFLFVVPLYFVAGINLLGDKNPFYYFIVFFLGYLLFTDNRYQQVIDKNAPAALITALLCELLRQFVFPFFYGSQGYEVVMWGIVQLGRWMWVLAIIGYGHRLINRSSKLSVYFSQAAFPFYLLHLPVNTFVGIIVIQTSLPVFAKYFLIVTMTFIITFLLYEVIKRIPVLRVMFGIKAFRKSVRPVQAVHLSPQGKRPVVVGTV